MMTYLLKLACHVQSVLVFFMFFTLSLYWRTSVRNIRLSVLLVNCIVQFAPHILFTRWRIKKQTNDNFSALNRTCRVASAETAIVHGESKNASLYFCPLYQMRTQFHNSFTFVLNTKFAIRSTLKSRIDHERVPTLPCKIFSNFLTYMVQRLGFLRHPLEHNYYSLKFVYTQVDNDVISSFLCYVRQRCIMAAVVWQ